MVQELRELESPALQEPALEALPSDLYNRTKAELFKDLVQEQVNLLSRSQVSAKIGMQLMALKLLLTTADASSLYDFLGIVSVKYNDIVAQVDTAMAATYTETED